MTRPLSRFLAAVLAASALALFALDTAAKDASEPTVAQIYQAASSGRLDRADSMIEQVLKAHPNSARAHYVKSELSAREGKIALAKQELAAAEKIDPGLPFAKSDSVQALRNQLANGGVTGANANAATTQPHATRQMGAPAGVPARNGFPWGTLAIVAAIVLVGAAVLRRRTAAIANTVPYGQPGYGAAPPMYADPGYGPAAYPQQPSMGSSIARGVGTGLAMGAGMVAAEEIGRRMFGHGDTHNIDTPSLDQIDDGMRRNLNSDMGGADFGMNDDGGWDAGGGDVGGGGDWDT